MSSPASMSTVDVVIPCYNYGRFLPACVSSVLSQNGVEVRILIIDDASSDDTAEIATELATLDKRIEFHRHDVNRGNIATYNEGLLEWSRKDYVVLLSADDMLAPGALARAAGVMNADRSIGMVYGRAIHFRNEHDLPRVNGSRFRHSVFPGDRWLDLRCRAGYNVITSPEVVVRGTIQRSIGGYRRELPHSGDLEMWLRIAAVANVGYIRAVPQAFYRVHSTNMTKQRDSFTDIQQRRAAFDAFFQSYQGINWAARLQECARRALAREALWRACRAYDRDQVEEAGAPELIAFALETYCGAKSLSEYAALRRRQRLGPAVCHRTQLFAPVGALHRFERWLKRCSWQRRGV